MATYDADLGMICRMRARYAPAAEAGIGMQVFRMMELLAPGSSPAPGRSGYRGRPAADRAVMIVT
jgi:hypothetical protein